MVSDFPLSGTVTTIKLSDPDFWRKEEKKKKKKNQIQSYQFPREVIPVWLACMAKIKIFFMKRLRKLLINLLGHFAVSLTKIIPVIVKKFGQLQQNAI